MSSMQMGQCFLASPSEETPFFTKARGDWSTEDGPPSSPRRAPSSRSLRRPRSPDIFPNDMSSPPQSLSLFPDDSPPPNADGVVHCENSSVLHPARHQL